MNVLALRGIDGQVGGPSAELFAEGVLWPGRPPFFEI
jgi:hypothetical protein